MYLSYCGIRVTELARSLKFYTEALGLKEVARGDNTDRGGGVYVLLGDSFSGQKLELNWYPPGSPYSNPYVPGEGLDHIAFRVDDVRAALDRLAARGAQVVDLDARLADLGGGVRVGYAKDPDGNWIELYEHSEPIGQAAPEGY